MEEPGSNGLAFDPEGRLILCEHGDRRITRLEADGRKTVLADSWQGCRLNSPNDIVCRSNGELWFTDPPYGLPGQLNSASKELPFHGVYRIGRSGDLALVLDSIDVPNGIAFSPDESTLYLTDGGPTQKRWLAFTVRHDGTLADRRVLFDANHLPGQGSPDGLVADAGGNLFATGLERVLVLSADGTHLGSIVPGGKPSNVAWGEDGATLFITSSSRLLRLRTRTRGARF